MTPSNRFEESNDQSINQSIDAEFDEIYEMNDRESESNVNMMF